MRTYIIIVLVLLSLKGFSQNHKEIFSVENDKLGVGWHWGRTGVGTDCPINVYAMNLLAGGFYIDVGGMPSKHGSDVRISVWDDRSAFFAHIGYQVPLTKWFRITY